MAKFISGHEGLPINLEDVLMQGLRPAFMPELIDHIIELDDTEVLGGHLNSASIRFVARDKNELLVGYAHVENSITKSPARLQYSTSNSVIHPFQGAVPIYKEEVQRLIGMDGLKDDQGRRLVWIDSYEEVVERNQREYEHISEHPEMIRFAGSEEQAKRFVEKFQKLTRPDRDKGKIGMSEKWFLERQLTEPEKIKDEMSDIFYKAGAQPLAISSIYSDNLEAGLYFGDDMEQFEYTKVLGMKKFEIKPFLRNIQRKYLKW